MNINKNLFICRVKLGFLMGTTKGSFTFTLFVKSWRVSFTKNINYSTLEFGPFILILYKSFSKEKFVFEYWKKGKGFKRIYGIPYFLGKAVYLLQKSIKKRSWGMVLYAGFQE